MSYFREQHDPIDAAVAQEELRILRAEIKANPEKFTFCAARVGSAAIMSSVPAGPVYVPPVVLSEEEQMKRASRFLFGK